MSNQNFKNHARFVPLFHFIFSSIILALLVLSITNIVAGVNIQSVMFLLLAVAFAIAFFSIRNFPIAVQDRAIRAEENLRHFVLTGKLLDSRLTMQQIIALRFAADEEFVDLAAKAVKENLGNKDIKLAVKNWRADHHRA
jgi:hypothetical protein